MSDVTPRPSLRQLAKVCKLSVAAVSMALRQHSRIAAKTARRVQAQAAKLGYRSSPLLQSVMSHVRSANVQRAWLNVGFIWLEATPESVVGDSFQKQTISSVLRRADQLGLHLEQFFLSAPGMGPLRLQQILLARGISGIIFSPSTYIPNVRLPFDWNRFSVVVIGNTPWTPEFHRSAHHHYRGMCTALDEATALGYRRPALILLENLNERANRTPEAAFVTHHPVEHDARKLVFRLDPDKAPMHFRRWLTRARPDCLIFPFTESYAPRFGGVMLSGKYPHAVLDQFIPSNLAGLHQDFEAIGSNAVDLLMSQLLHNDRGVPHRSKIVLAEGNWCGSNSLSPIRNIP